MGLRVDSLIDVPYHLQNGMPDASGPLIRHADGVSFAFCCWCCGAPVRGLRNGRSACLQSHGLLLLFRPTASLGACVNAAALLSLAFASSFFVVLLFVFSCGCLAAPP